MYYILYIIIDIIDIDIYLDQIGDQRGVYYQQGIYGEYHHESGPGCVFGIDQLNENE